MTLHNLRGEWWGVEVPEGAINFKFDMGYLIWKEPNYKAWVNDDILSDYNRLQKHLEKHKGDDDYKTGGIPLSGTWQIICLSGECTEEVAKEIVEKVIYPNEPVYYKIYDEDSDVNATTDFTESFNSLLRSKGLNEKNTLILKQVR
jgi:hypothetical protein